MIKKFNEEKAIFDAYIQFEKYIGNISSTRNEALTIKDQDPAIWWYPQILDILYQTASISSAPIKSIPWSIIRNKLD